METEDTSGNPLAFTRGWVEPLDIPSHRFGYDTFHDILAEMELFTLLKQDKCPSRSSFDSADGETVSRTQFGEFVPRHHAA
ncbi:hypothetical protein RU639_001314 [Aspergillus parasiticus]